MKFILLILVGFLEVVAARLGKTLVLLDSMSIKDTHSIFFKMLEDRGYELKFEKSDEQSLILEKYGEFLYKHLILFTPSTEEFGGNVNIQLLTDFIDRGGNVIGVADSNVGDVMKELAAECGFEVDAEGNQVVDHHNYDVNLDNGEHSTIVVDSSQILNVSSIVGSKKLSPILFKGIGLSTNRKNPLVTTVVHGSPTSYSFSSAKILQSPLVAGKKGALIAALQARNNARILFSGSLDLFSDKFLTAAVKSSSGVTTARSGNRDLLEALVRWVFKETGVLRYSEVKHGGPYTVMDTAHFSMKVEMLDDEGKWVAYDTPSIQIEFVRMDPFIRTAMKRKDDTGTYEVTFKVPDVYGVYRFKVDHRRKGFDHLVVTSQVSVHPLQHTMYERFIPAAKPYYWSSFSMMIGLFVFSFVFIHQKDTAVKPKKE